MGWMPTEVKFGRFRSDSVCALWLPIASWCQHALKLFRTDLIITVVTIRTILSLFLLSESFMDPWHSCLALFRIVC